MDHSLRARNDYYLSNPPHQPKREIAEYVRMHGIHVPKIYSDFDEAQKSKKPVLARTEHPQDYAGSSDLFAGFWFNRQVPWWRVLGKAERWSRNYDRKNLENGEMPILGANMQLFKDEAQFKELERAYYMERVKNHCGYLGLDFNEFMKDFSYSYWELRSGFNITIVADSAIAGRYHVMTVGLDQPGQIHGSSKNVSYCIVDEEGLTDFSEQRLLVSLDPVIAKRIRDLVELYEKVRNLEMFNPVHCPIMEWQFYNDQFYFLQYHRTIDFEPATFVLDRPLEKGEVKVPFVRGASASANGRTYKTIIVDKRKVRTLDQYQEGSGCESDRYDGVYGEIMLRRRDFQIVRVDDPVHPKGSIDKVLWNNVTGHTARSMLFKPRLSVIYRMDAPIISENELDKLDFQATINQDVRYIHIHAVSDGRTAYLKRVD